MHFAEPDISDVRPGDKLTLRSKAGATLSDVTVSADLTIAYFPGLSLSGLANAGWELIAIDRAPTFTPGLYAYPKVAEPIRAHDLYVATETHVESLITGQDVTARVASDPEWGEHLRLAPQAATAKAIIGQLRTELSVDGALVLEVLDDVLSRYTR